MTNTVSKVELESLDSANPKQSNSEKSAPEPVVSTTARIWKILPKIRELIAAFAPLYMPAVIAAIGWMVQSRLTDATISKDYVAMAVNILSTKTASVDPLMRGYAVDLLNEYSKVELKPELAAKLAAGQLSLPDNKVIAQLVATLKQQIVDAEVRDRAALLGLRLPRDNAKIKAAAEELLRNPETQEAGKELLDAVENPPSVEIQVGK